MSPEVLMVDLLFAPGVSRCGEATRPTPPAASPLPWPLHHRGRCITAGAVSPRALYHRGRCITAGAASPRPLRHRGRCITAGAALPRALRHRARCALTVLVPFADMGAIKPWHLFICFVVVVVIVAAVIVALIRSRRK
ncbi:hypothetical protein GCM10012284_50780 [Mangrovihabitans endophyticus]|uniref:Uncharacterized protein n=1 Tax=Mangrovihabitans endophyticus TaxID=1751298 RepID=A0A8J3FRJ5_9ACTN|nr:hypothetical protein GCM10012284_50780 [Mangrovihabitans endophyticus]